ncbi:MAG: MurT ligase domain-containing protein [Tractidigestivibacter sp.]|jgi:UDP-N-acetylmuramyl tripeptide synthase|uniref:MurT ligase domain-containing protein n=1 Tax=Tractidigestivibacter sp. TaxID=2847320 RepID=UPI003D8B34F8
MSFRSSVAVGLGRATTWALRSVLHRSASQMPGRVAMAIDPTVISDLAGKVGEGSVVVCGTNGKTTTNNIIANAIERSGRTVLCNRAGANMAPGVAAALLPGSRADVAVIEADELSTPAILSQLHPRYLVLLNLFRDQLDRAGEIDRVQDTIVKALASSPETKLLVCGDDPLSMGVAVRAKAQGTEVLSFGIGEDLHLPPDRVPEARFCQVCGAELEYDYRAYAQLGAFRCPNGDFARPKLDFVATGVVVDPSGVSFEVSFSDGTGGHVSAGFGGVYMVYNLLAAASVSHLFGVSPEQFQEVLNDYHPENGRLQHFSIGGREVILNLAKNPTGFNQNISLLQTDTRDKAVMFVINDDFNDGKDISWIWDVDFERFADDPSLIAFAGGHRANDVQVRMKYAGIKAPVVSSVTEALGRLGDTPLNRPLYVLCNYSALWPAKAELEKMGARHV